MAKKKKKERIQKPGRVSKPVKAAPSWHLPFILLLTLLAYIPALSAGFVNWDDPDYVINNLLIRNLSGLNELLTTPIQGNHHPLTMLSLAFNYMISGDQAWSYHLLNLALHMVNAFLVYRFAWLLSRGNSFIAFTVSLLFAVHPMHVESVAWVSERKDVLFTLFFLLGHIRYVKNLDKGKERFSLSILIFLILALLSKPAAVVFPVSLMTIDILRKRPLSYQLITHKLIYFIPAIVMGIITLQAQKEIGATGEANFGILKHMFFGFYSIMMYAVKMIIPFGLSAFYPFPPLNESLSPVYLLSPVFSILLIILLIRTWKKYREPAFGISFYIVNLLLILQFFSVGSAIIAERYTYIPYIGLFYVLAFYLDRWIKKQPSRAFGIVIASGLAFTLLSYRHAEVWKSGETLWDNVIRFQPCSRAYSSRAQLYKRDKQYEKAIEYYTEAVRLNKIDQESYNNRANIYIDQGKFDLAFEDYKRSLEIKPDNHLTCDNVGAYYARKGMFDSALFFLNKAISLKPDYKPAYSNRGLTFMSLKRYDEAISDFENYLKLEPGSADIINTIGLCYRLSGRNQEALNYINRAIRINPQPPFFLNRSYTYFELNQPEQARQDALMAKQGGLVLDPSYAAQLGIQ